MPATDTTAHVDPDNTQLGEVICGHQMLAVPLDRRSSTDLLSLQAGVGPQTSVTSQTVQAVGANALSSSGSLNPGTVSINRERELANAFVVNGTNVEEDVDSGTATVPNLDSIDECCILISNFRFTIRRLQWWPNQGNHQIRFEQLSWQCLPICSRYGARRTQIFST